MTLQEFEMLDDTTQEEIIFNRGEFLGTESEDNLIFDFYKVDDFFVQFSYEINKNERAIITTFSDASDIFLFDDSRNIPSNTLSA